MTTPSSRNAAEFVITDDHSKRVLATTAYADIASAIAHALVPQRSLGVTVEGPGIAYRIAYGFRTEQIQKVYREDVPRCPTETQRASGDGPA